MLSLIIYSLELKNDKKVVWQTISDTVKVVNKSSTTNLPTL